MLERPNYKEIIEEELGISLGEETTVIGKWQLGFSRDYSQIYARLRRKKSLSGVNHQGYITFFVDGLEDLKELLT